MEKVSRSYVFCETPPFEQDYLRRQYDHAAGGVSAQVSCFEEPLQDLKCDLSGIEVLSVFIKSKVDASVLKKMPALKLVTTRSTGFDHIDLNFCREHHIAVANVPAYGENTVAEHTFALILSLSRNLRKAYLRTLQNNFSLDGLMGFDLKGKTLGVVGTGRIGLHVIRMGLGFGMKVLASDVRQQPFLAEVMGFEYAPFESVLGRSDILTLHTPYMPQTRHLINEQTIQKIKPGAVLVNTSRGGLIETGALVKALDTGILSGAGLDVLEEEECLLEEKRLQQDAKDEEDHWRKLQTTLKNHVLLHRENVIYTPHMAFYSREAVIRILETTVNNIGSFEKGCAINQVA